MLKTHLPINNKETIIESILILIIVLFVVVHSLILVPVLLQAYKGDTVGVSREPIDATIVNEAMDYLSN